MEQLWVNMEHSLIIIIYVYCVPVQFIPKVALYTKNQSNKPIYTGH